MLVEFKKCSSFCRNLLQCKAFDSQSTVNKSNKENFFAVSLFIYKRVHKDLCSKSRFSFFSLQSLWVVKSKSFLQRNWNEHNAIRKCNEFSSIVSFHGAPYKCEHDLKMYFLMKTLHLTCNIQDYYYRSTVIALARHSKHQYNLLRECSLFIAASKCKSRVPSY